MAGELELNIDNNNDIEKALNPNVNILQIRNEIASAEIFDAELDPIECSFNYDACVQINTDGYSHITLTLENLETLKKLIIQAENYYDKKYDKKSKNKEKLK